MESAVKSKPSRVVPTSSSGNNILASLFGLSSTGGSRQCEAWSENERHGSAAKQDGEDDANLSEPFIRKESESSESSSAGTTSDGGGDSARLFVKPKGRIYAIDFDGEKKGLKGKPSAVSNSSSPSDGKLESHCDAKVVDKFVRTNQRKQQSSRRKKKRKNAKSVLVKLCQCCPWTVPWSLLVVSAIQICTYIFNNDTLYQTLIFSPVRQFQIWRFVTYTFLHAGAVHLMLNVIIQIMVAFPLETEQGHGAVLAVYGAGVVAGGLGASVFEPTPMVGASAGVYCLLMSHIPHIVMNFQSLSHRYFRLVAVLLLCVSDVIYSIRHCLTKGNLQPRIGVAAHVSGAICGLLIGFIVYRGGEKTMAFRIARYAGMLLYVAWIVATVVYNVEKKF
uniref:Putative rhomboid family n=1 Tax=Culex tarsalis TaxID=7177 RepID=A0A1Q3FSA0_CULTA